MAELTDITGTTVKFEREIARWEGNYDKYDSSELSNEDADAVLRYARDAQLEDGLEPSTLRNYLSVLRTSAESANKPLVEHDHEEFRDLMATVKRERDLSNSSLRNYRVAARELYKYVGKEWAEDISTKRNSDSNVDPDDLLQRDEFSALMETVDNTRDKAIVAALFDTGLRVSALGTLRVGDVNLESDVPKITLNTEASGLKGASGTRPLTWSAGYIGNWLDVHPSPEPEHPLWHKKRLYEDGDRALSYTRIWEILKDNARDADVDPDKVHPHNFRHTAISRWVREGFSDQEIKHRATWHEDSSMLSVYSHVRDEDMNSQIAERYGIVDDEESTPSLDRCARCRTELPDPMPRCCPGCGTPLKDSAVEVVEQVEQDALDDLVSLDAGDAETIREFLDVLKSNPEIVEELGHHESI